VVVDLWVSLGGCWVDYPCDWALAPVIGLRSLWLDLGPCDWVHYPCDWFHYPRDWVDSPLWLDYGPCDWTSVPVIGLITPAYQISGFGLLSVVGFGMMVGMGIWWLVLRFPFGSLVMSPCLFCWYLMVLGYDWSVSLWLCSVGILFMDLLSYTLVIEYWFRSDESWFTIRSVYCCWISVLNYWTVCWCLYSIWVCKPIYNLYVYLYFLAGVSGGYLEVFC